MWTVIIVLVLLGVVMYYIVGWLVEFVKAKLKNNTPHVPPPPPPLRQRSRRRRERDYSDDDEELEYYSDDY